MLPDPTAPREVRKWNQGSLLTIEAVNSLVDADFLPREWENKGYALVISHPCDLAADIAVEPFVEFVLATPIEQPDGNYRYGKSGRTLHLDATIDDRREHFAISIHNYARVRRTDLEPPDAQLDKQATQLVARWISRRYTRSAFPDTFNRRIDSRRPAMRKLLRREGHHISGIYLLLSSEEELYESVEYEIGLRATMRVADYEDSALRMNSQGAVDKLAELFNEVEGVGVDDHELCNEASMSLDDLRFYLRWDVDDLSLRDEDAALAPDR